MTTFPTDNTDNGDIMRSVTWQYADASKLVGALEILKEAFDQTTKDFFNSFVAQLNVSSEDAFGLSVLGKCLGIPKITSIPNENYRKLLIGRVKLLNSDATLKDYREYVEDVFGEYVVDSDSGTTEYKVYVSVSDTLKMGLLYEIASDAPPWVTKLITKYPDIAFVFPSGVRSSKHSDSLMFGLGPEKVFAEDGETVIRNDRGQQPATTDDPDIGGLDNSGLNWRLTPKGNWQ